LSDKELTGNSTPGGELAAIDQHLGVGKAGKIND